MEFISSSSLIALLKAAGYVGIFGIVFTESGLLIGVFLPGDSLLFTAGFLASQGYLNITLLAITTTIAAIAGDNFGYWIGKTFGHRVFSKEKSLFFNKKYVEQAEEFYKKHGRKTVILARFVPVVRSIAPVLAGISRMPYKIYLVFSLIGALLWATGLTLLGYFLGNTIPNIDKYLLPIIAGIVLVSVLPSLITIAKEKKVIERFITGETALIKRYPKIKKSIGIALIVYGLFALITPFTPGALLVFVGAELVGIRLAFFEKIKSWFKK